MGRIIPYALQMTAKDWYTIAARHSYSPMAALIDILISVGPAGPYVYKRDKPIESMIPISSRLPQSRQDEGTSY